MRRAIAFAVCLTGAFLVTAGGAGAAFPGANGQIAFERQLPGGGTPTDIFTIGPQGENPTPLAANPDNDLNPSYSGDGEKIAFERGKETLTMARIVYRHLSTFYTWALTRLEHLPANPCRDAWRPKRSEPRDRVLSDRELAALWQAAVEDGYPFGHLVQMLVLTAQRRGEVLDATCDVIAAAT